MLEHKSIKKKQLKIDKEIARCNLITHSKSVLKNSYLISGLPRKNYVTDRSEPRTVTLSMV